MSDEKAYQVLARKYRPQTFADLIGQEAMVRTLKNAFAADRIAHAFVMTGVRGVGKTTTARIIAKGLNCVGPDGNGGPTTEPCGLCKPCIGISEGRFFDVLEIDAASSTGVDNIRELNSMANTRPAEGRFKIFIIDEVHMLSINAFNALLKTLEEPRGHTKFIMATTEIRKVPVTVLSRCQRFDLKRIEPEVMMAHLSKVADLEGAKLAPDALALITRAAEGSVRDAMSLMDQAIAHGAGETTGDQVRAMLGLADRGRTLDLFDLIMKGEAATALAELSAQYADGADPMAVLRDLAEITHWISVIKINPAAAEDPTTPPDEQSRGQDMASRLPMRALTRMWQMLLKAIEEVALAPNAMMAAEMAVIRLTHVADLPDPETLVRKLSDSPRPPAGAMPGGAPAGGGTVHAPRLAPVHAAPTRGPVMTAAAPVLAESQLQVYASFEQVIELIRAKRDMLLLNEVETGLRLVRYAPGRIEFEPAPGAKPDLAARLGQRLQGWTGSRWGVSVVASGGQPTIAEARNTELAEVRAQAADNPLVQAILTAFPGAKITDVRSPEAITAEAAEAALPQADPEVDDDWDPFEA
ncbi:MAG: DNA polymerase III subunit gamma/tau [Rhodobacterales bacterium]|nr:DNA polymerase III subunit gamma/tau [Rhodobacterales bacterium]